MSAVRVSCVVPVRNGERFLAEALESILSQTRPPEEVLVVDDGSTDGTPAVAAAFRPRVRYLAQPAEGPSAARNAGIRRAAGDLVSFLDADDLWHAGKLERQLEWLAGHPELDGCVCQVQNFWMPELAEEERAFQGQPFAGPLPAFTFPALLARRALFDTVGLLNETLRAGEDVEWFLRVREAGGSVGVVPEVLLRRRLHSGNLTRGDLASRDTLLASLRASLARRRGGGPAA